MHAYVHLPVTPKLSPLREIPRPLDGEPAFERLNEYGCTVVTTLSAPQPGEIKKRLCKKPGRCQNYRGRLIVTLIIVIIGGIIYNGARPVLGYSIKHNQA